MGSSNGPHLPSGHHLAPVRLRRVTDQYAGSTPARAPEYQDTNMRDRIIVTDYSDVKHGSPPWCYDPGNPPNIVEYKVDALCIGGPDGVRAYFMLDGMFCTAHGDDGHWWLASMLSVGYLPETIKSLEALLSAEKENNNGLLG